MNLDVKSLAAGFLIGALVCAVIYGCYIKIAGDAVFDQVDGYNHFIECTSLLTSSNPEKISSFLNALPQKRKDLEKSDAIMTATSTALNGEFKLAGMGQPLEICSKALLEHYQRVKN